MRNHELAEVGKSLAAELDELASGYHVKSDEYDILSWEADILRAKARVISEGGILPENLRESTLLSEWGARLSKELPELSRRVSAFHSQYAQAAASE